MRKICVITGTRAEFGLLRPLLDRINRSRVLELQLVVTGMHLSPEFGYTITEIEKQGFKVDRKVECLLSSDSAVGVSKSMGLAQISFAETYDDLKPDFVLVLGDRFEILSAVTTAMIMKIPKGDISGGELTGGAIDDTIRHAITKMSSLHFVATKEYRKRVIQMGEHPDRVFNFGEAGLDNIKDLILLSRSDFEKSVNHKLNKKNLLITYHPETRCNDNSKKLKQILEALDCLEDTLLIFTKSNADEGGREINLLIDEYVNSHNTKSICFTSLGQLRYLSALQYIDAVVGNTSSGIVEAPSFKVATINIGDRQKGRIQAQNVLNCRADKEEIKKALEVIYTLEFKELLKNVENPYGQGNSSDRTVKVLEEFPIQELVNKEFVDFNICDQLVEK